ncbi:MAG TPA: LuxR C-terminal-related transcriptional regulator [Chloroflexota bacterium]
MQINLAPLVRGRDPLGLPHPLHLLGTIALIEGDAARAEANFQEVLDLAQRTADRLYGAAALGGLSDAVLRVAGIESAAGNLVRVARLLGAFSGHWRGAVLLGDSPLMRFQRLSTALSERVGAAAFTQAIATGQALDLDRAVADALSALSDAPERPGDAGPLTQREREVASLIAAGNSNREIGRALVVAEATVERHVANIMAKLGCHSRAQVAAWHERAQHDRVLTASTKHGM